MNDSRLITETLVIGSGIAGLSCALKLADQGCEVTLITTGDRLDGGNTALAQGGIVYQEDGKGAQALEKDIIRAGWSHNSKRAVRHLARNGGKAVHDVLIQRLNTPFAKSDSCEWDLRLEGGHSANRVLHCTDFTGRAIMDGLIREVEANDNIRILPNRTAVDLLTSHHHATALEFKYALSNECVGAYVFNELSGLVETILADFTVLATGGVGQVYLHTTNSSSSIGSGLAMAHRAGARVLNSEFVQFHPTALFHRAERRFLITEAMRGEGARLLNSSGERFMSRYDPRKDLAPRDIVARAIVEEMLRNNDSCVYLDAANFVEGDLTEHFPTIFRSCLELGIDIRKEPIPVVPAAHYFCGGVLVDLQGRTTLERLYCVGEASCTGVHGANRLASTSLLEGVQWGVEAGQDIGRKMQKPKIRLRKRLAGAIADWESPGQNMNEDPALLTQDWSNIRHTMWNYVGITRSKPRLQRALDDLRNLYKHLNDFYRRTPLSKSLVDLFHGCHAAYIITVAAQRNKSSLGCHYRVD